MTILRKIVSGLYRLQSREERAAFYGVEPRHLYDKVIIFDAVEIRSAGEIILDGVVPPGYSECRLPRGTTDVLPWVSPYSVSVTKNLSPCYPRLSLRNFHPVTVPVKFTCLGHYDYPLQL